MKSAEDKSDCGNDYDVKTLDRASLVTSRYSLASCVGQPRETIKLICTQMKNMSTAQRIEKALDRSRQRYGISGSFSSEPKRRAFCYGSKVSFNTTLLDSFNKDLNTLKIFAYAHDEVEKPNLSQPGFESLQKFNVHKIDMATSDYAQTFF